MKICDYRRCLQNFTMSAPPPPLVGVIIWSYDFGSSNDMGIKKFSHLVVSTNYQQLTTLNIVYSGTYYLELRNAITIYCI